MESNSEVGVRKWERNGSRNAEVGMEFGSRNAEVGPVVVPKRRDYAGASMRNAELRKKYSPRKDTDKHGKRNIIKSNF